MFGHVLTTMRGFSSSLLLMITQFDNQIYLALCHTETENSLMQLQQTELLLTISGPS
jgi:hypothetical protein